MRTAGKVVLLLWSLVASGSVYAQLYAGQLDDSNTVLRPGGVDAIAGRGDWLLSNGTLCAGITDVPHEIGLSATGGWLVDLAHCGRDDDQFNYTHQLPAMDKTRILPARRIWVDEGDGWVAVVVERSSDSLSASVRYQMYASRPTELEITRTISRTANSSDVSMIGQAWLHPHRSLTPFGLSTRYPERSPGFSFPAFDRDDTSSSLGAMLPVDVTVLLGSPVIGPGISYGIISEDATRTDSDGDQETLLQFSLTEADYSNQGWLSEGLWLDSDGLASSLAMLQSLLMDMDIGDQVRIRQRVLVGQRADVASVTDQLYQGHTLQGRIQGAGARVQVNSIEGYPITETVPNANGDFSVRLPKGIKEVMVDVMAGQDVLKRIPVSVETDGQSLPDINLEQPGKLFLEQDQPMRLVVKGRNATPDPLFNDDLVGFSYGGVRKPASASSNIISLVGDDSDPVSIELPQGDYRVYASRGIEYSAGYQDIAVQAGKPLKLAPFSLELQLDTSGLTSADFHVHSGYSFDSATSPEQRLRSFIAQGADVLVATEHDNLVDLGQLSRALGWQDKLLVINGAELTGMAPTPVAPRTIGHINVYPLAYQAGAFSGGMPLHEGMLLRDVIGELKEQPIEPVVQMNHPRDVNAPDADLSFFEHTSQGLRYDPNLPLDSPTNAHLLEPNAAGLRDIDFDVLELFNGRSLLLYQQVRADWVALMLQGEYRPAVASSDSHNLYDPVAMPRSYVRAGVVADFNAAGFFNALRAGKVSGTTGPLVSLMIVNEQGDSALPGETLSGQSFHLQLSVQAADWVAVDTALVYINGQAQLAAIEPGKDLLLPLEVEADAAVWVEVYGQPGEVYRALAPGYRPMAFTNPVWLDTDGDGQWSAPGIGQVPTVVSEPTFFPAQ